MSKKINILSLLLLVVYGTLTLVAVPLHQHAMNYVDIPQYHTTVAHHGADCSVCTFAAQSITTPLSIEDGSVVLAQSEKPSSTELPKAYTLQFTKEYPRRGPPAISL